MMYKLLRSLLFCLPPELAHKLSLRLLAILVKYHLWPKISQQASAPVRAFGLTFPNAIGVAAGLDKNGEYIDALAALGFGFIEVGTVTPKPQAGNPKPRLFRLVKQRALINRLGFNNQGVDALIHNIKRSQYQGILGINIGKNASTPLEQALDDYQIAMTQVYPYASYLVVNISSPNTVGLRDLQQGKAFTDLLQGLQQTHQQLEQEHNKRVPMLVKIAPDVTQEQIKTMAEAILAHGFDGIIATNTTIDHSAVADNPLSQEKGGLSGAPLHTPSTQVLQMLCQAINNKIPIIGVGGIDSVETAKEKLNQGATLIQLYTGFIYRGPGLIKQLITALSSVNITNDPGID